MLDVKAKDVEFAASISRPTQPVNTDGLNEYRLLVIMFEYLKKREYKIFAVLNIFHLIKYKIYVPALFEI